MSDEQNWTSSKEGELREITDANSHAGRTV